MCNCNKGSSPAKKSVIRNPPNIFPKVAARKVVKASVAPPAGTGFADTIEVGGDTIEDKCRIFAYMLGLDTPVTERVLATALDNPGYGRRLLANRENQAVLYDLLNNPPENGISDRSYSGSDLLAKASKALMKWAVSGFPTVSKDVLRRREDACLACPNLVEPTHALQRYSAPASAGVTVGHRTGNAICSSCGCVVRNKMRLATEACPEHIAGNEGMSRWGEERK